MSPLFSALILLTVFSRYSAGDFLTCEDKKYILDEHNILRNKVAGGKVEGLPSAEYMMELVWDNELAEQAGRTETWEKGLGNSVRLQNKMRCSVESTISDGIASWFGEKHVFGKRFRDNKLYFKMVWANTTKVGCSYRIHQKGRFMDCYLTCIYEPKTPDLTVFPYHKGERNCSKINALNSTNFNNLCGVLPPIASKTRPPSPADFVKEKALIGVLSPIASKTPPPNPADFAKEKALIGYSLTCEEKKYILDQHNNLRNKVAGGEVERLPSAEYMMELVWDNELAEQAGRTETWEKGLGNSVRLQNKMRCSVESTISDGIASWFGEKHVFGKRFRDNKLYFKMVWANTTKVGCSYRIHQKGRFMDCYLTCIYEPKTPDLTVFPYHKGERNCSKINALNSTNFNNLCVLPQNPSNGC